MEALVIGPMIAMALLFVVLVTKLWNKSISTAIHAITVATSMYFFTPCEPEVSMGIIFAGVLINMFRAVVNTERDKFVKRNPSIT